MVGFSNSSLEYKDSADDRIAYLNSTYRPVLDKATEGRLTWELDLTQDVERFTASFKNPQKLSAHLNKFFSIPSETQRGVQETGNTVSVIVPLLAAIVTRFKTTEEGKKFLEEAAREYPVLMEAVRRAAVSHANEPDALKNIDLSAIDLNGVSLEGAVDGTTPASFWPSQSLARTTNPAASKKPADIEI
ncbi:MAG: hypothetical protein K0R63_986 [Rickettsiales bacterium]|jgi:hypothetical protein|nr:hypothetical protein [Rickettsiales bacterium]